MSGPDTVPAPRVRFVDHLRVLWLLVLTVAGGLPFLLYIPLSPLLTPWLRARGRRRLARPAPPPASPPAIDAAAAGRATVFVVAGEASGDVLAASIVRRMKAAAPGLTVRGYGGPACAAAGVALDRELTGRAVFGFFGVVWSLGFWWRVCAETLARFREAPPDLLLTVDFPGLNVRLARWARGRGIATVHVVAPQLWAHTPWRILRWRAAVDRVLATFPFEPRLFAGTGLRTTYVGHPLFEAPLPPPRGADAWPAGEAVIELWPGSRRREIARHAAVLLEAGARIEAARPGATHFRVRLADPAHAALFEAARARARATPTHVEAATGDVGSGPPLLGALVASGTATAELAVDLVPMCVFYRVGFVEWCFAKILVTAPYIALVNLLRGRGVVSERITFARGAGERIAADFLRTVAPEPAWTSMRAELAAVREALETPGVAERAARHVIAALPLSARQDTP
jgi:lipid-A-disaccharide synthase